MFEPIWTQKQRRVLRLLALVWLGVTILFWVWWFQPSHVGTRWGFVLTTWVMLWALAVPGYCWFFLLRMKRPTIAKLPANWRVAMVVTRAPSEPFALVQRTLTMMLAQAYPHDTWVADEDPTPEMQAWYKKHRVRVSCRKDNPEYHNQSWPRRRKCKEGNLAYFYDHYGYEHYDFVAQMDVDHVPEQGYLERILLPFVDESVGYVSAPSVGDRNESESWAARARSNAEGMFHGPIQAGTNDGWAPICIGSHYAVRVKALQQVGGIGPELAEDFSTTVALNAGGWKGVWSYDAKAHGDGPQTFADLLIQDYQWSRSMAILLLTYFPKKWIKLPWRPKVQMAFAELWYPFGATAWLASIVLAPLAIITGHAPVRVDFGTFGGLVVVPYLLTLGLYAYTRSQGHLRPERLKVVSWENALFELARWYWVLKAEVDALTVVLFRRKLEFRVTPKEVASGIVGVPNKILVPFAVIAVGNLVAVTLYRGEPEVVGYVGFALVSALAYMLLVGLVLGLQAWEQRGRRIQALVRYLPQFAFAGSLWVWLVLLLGMGSLMSVHKPVPQGAPETSVVLGENTQIRDNDIAVVEEYTVREGDSLWNIAQTRYGRGQDYTKIQRGRTGVLRTGEVLTFSQ